MALIQHPLFNAMFLLNLQSAGSAFEKREPEGTVNRLGRLLGNLNNPGLRLQAEERSYDRRQGFTKCPVAVLVHMQLVGLTR